MALRPTAEMRAVLERGPASGLEQGEIDRVLTVAAIAVRRWVDPEGEGADLPPQEIETEAVIRTAGFILDSPPGPVASRKVADVETAFTSGRMQNPVRGSGAMSLLGPWKKRGAGALA